MDYDDYIGGASMENSKSSAKLFFQTAETCCNPIPLMQRMDRARTKPGFPRGTVPYIRGLLPPSLRYSQPWGY